MSRHSLLAIPSHVGAPLDPQQRKFNQLLAKVEKARVDLERWQTESASFAAAYEECARPLLGDLRERRVLVARRLDALLAEKGWAKGERLLLRELVCDVAAGLVEEGELQADEEQAIKALHDKHADVDFDTDARESMAGMKSLFEAMSGIELGDEEIGSEEEMLQRAHERLKAQAEAQAQAQRARAEKKKGKSQASPKALREQEEAEDAARTVRDVFRKLAAALHPDRASDESDRRQRTERMQRANQAYERQDLLALLALQLEIEQVDAAHVARVSSERARQLNKLLTEQLRELQAELLARQAAFTQAYGLDPFASLKVSQLGGLLQREMTELRALLAQADRELQILAGPRAGTKHWLKKVKREREEEARFEEALFDLPF